MQIIGVISDTHGLFRPQVPAAFRDVSRILHAGDIGSPEVLDRLRQLAPVTAIRGNNDTANWATEIPETELVRAGDISIYMLHNLKEIEARRPKEDFQVVIAGHSHRPQVQERDGILFLNPGSAGPRRFRLPVTVARLTIRGTSVSAELVELRTGSGFQ